MTSISWLVSFAGLAADVRVMESAILSSLGPGLATLINFHPEQVPGVTTWASGSLVTRDAISFSCTNSSLNPTPGLSLH